ncbi:MAG: hypothetical protein IV100_06575 [Myxococcales bacterium]|nr:hypothetical protein [Myxococcales bacterium]
MIEWIVAGTALLGVAAGTTVVLLRRRRARQEALAIADASARKRAFENAEVIIHEVERLSLAETQRAGGADADSPYEFRAELTVRPAAELDWSPLDLALVTESVAAGDVDVGPLVRLSSVEVLRAADGAPASRGPQRLRLTFRAQSPVTTIKLEYGGAVFGRVTTMGVAVVSERPIPASLRAPAVALAVAAPSRPAGPTMVAVAKARVVSADMDEGLWAAPASPPPTAAVGPVDSRGPARPAALSALDELLSRPELQGNLPAGTAMLGGSAAAPRKARPKPPASQGTPLAPAVGAALASRPARIVFEVYSRSPEYFDTPPVVGLDAAALRPVSRASAIDDVALVGLFDVDAIVRDATEPPSAEVAAIVRSADHVHRVIIERANIEDSSHIADGLTTAVSIAKVAGGVIRDAVSGRFLTPDQARRILKARRFAIVDHVLVTSRPETVVPGGVAGVALRLRTRGLSKFGSPELEATFVPKEHLRTVRQALLTLADLRSTGTVLAPGMVIQLGPAPLTLVATPDGTLMVSDADAMTHAPSPGLGLWLDAVALAA